MCQYSNAKTVYRQSYHTYFVKQVTELIWELWFYFCQCLISCHADALRVKGFMWLSGKMTNKVVWRSSSLFSRLITFGFWARSMSEFLMQINHASQSRHLICRRPYFQRGSQRRKLPFGFRKKFYNPWLEMVFLVSVSIISLGKVDSPVLHMYLLQLDWESQHRCQDLKPQES